MPSRAPAPIKFSLVSLVHTCACMCLFASVKNSVMQAMPLKRVLRKAQELFSKRKVAKLSTMLAINFSISWIYLEFSCFYFSLTKCVLNDIFEDIIFWKGRVVVIKSRVVFFCPCSFTFKSLRCYTTSAKNPTASLSLLFPKNAENAAMPFFTFCWFPQKKQRFFPGGTKSPQTLRLLKHLSLLCTSKFG